MGKYDLVEQVLAQFEAEFFFTGAQIQPGRPVVFGRIPCGAGIPAREDRLEFEKMLTVGRARLQPCR